MQNLAIVFFGTLAMKNCKNRENGEVGLGESQS
jgi:hypothetical protein